MQDKLLFLAIMDPDRLNGADEGLVSRRTPIDDVGRGEYVDAADGAYGIPGMDGDEVFVLRKFKMKR